MRRLGRLRRVGPTQCSRLVQAAFGGWSNVVFPVGPSRLRWSVRRSVPGWSQAGFAGSVQRSVPGRSKQDSPGQSNAVFTVGAKTVRWLVRRVRAHWSRRLERVERLERVARRERFERFEAATGEKRQTSDERFRRNSPRRIMPTIAKQRIDNAIVTGLGIPKSRIVITAARTVIDPSNEASICRRSRSRLRPTAIRMPAGRIAASGARGWWLA